MVVRQSLRHGATVFAAAWLLTCWPVVNAEGQSPAGEPQERTGEAVLFPNQTDQRSAPHRFGPPRTIELSSLPAAPERIARLIREGKVTLLTGGTPYSDPSKLPDSIRLAGETRIKFKYRYKGEISWVSGGRLSQTPSVVVRVRFKSIELVRTHEVWLRDPPVSDAFWQNSVVRHEFDHVQISTDPRVKSYFVGEVRKLRSFEVSQREVVDGRGRVEDAKVRDLIDRRMQEALDRTRGLVQIRYQELDRVTRHGILPLPDGFSLRPKVVSGVEAGSD